MTYTQDVPVSTADAERSTVTRLSDYRGQLISALEQVPLETIALIGAIMQKARANGNQVFVVGNGGSSATASHFVTDFSKLDLEGAYPRIRAQALTENNALLTAWANDFGYERVFAEQLNNLAGPGDILLALSGSGNSPNVVQAVIRARELGVYAIALTGKDGGRLKDIADLVLIVDSFSMGQIEDVHHSIGHMLTVILGDSDVIP